VWIIIKLKSYKICEFWLRVAAVGEKVKENANEEGQEIVALN
jgi:hypothetical protein